MKKKEKKPEKDMDEAADSMAKLALAKMEKMMEAKAAKTKTTKKVGITKDQVKTMSGKERTEKFIKALLSNDKARLKVLSTGVNALGGFLVPSYWYDKIVEEMRDVSDIRQRSTIIDPCPATLYINQLDSRPVSYWRGEKSIKDTSTAKFAQISLTPYSHAVIITCTKELVADAEVGVSNIIDYLTKLVVQEMAEEDERMFMTGTGVTQPTGIDNYNATIARSVTTGAGVADVDTLIAAKYRLGSKYLRNAVWILNSDTLRRIMQLKDTNNQLLFIPDPSDAEKGTLLGIPVIRNDWLNQTRGWLIDLKGYYVGVREGINVSQSEEAYLTPIGSLWERNMVAIRVEERIDGELADLHCACVLNGL